MRVRLWQKPEQHPDSGTDHDLDDAKVKFRAAWARIRAGLTDADIAKAQRYAEAVARYDGEGREGLGCPKSAKCCPRCCPGPFLGPHVSGQKPQ